MFRRFEAVVHPLSVGIAFLFVAFGYFIGSLGLFSFFGGAMLFTLGALPKFKRKVYNDNQKKKLALFEEKVQKKAWIFHHTYQNFEKDFRERLVKEISSSSNLILREEIYEKGQGVKKEFLNFLRKLEGEVSLWDKSLALGKPSPLNYLCLKKPFLLVSFKNEKLTNR